MMKNYKEDNNFIPGMSFYDARKTPIGKELSIIPFWYDQEIGSTSEIMEIIVSSDCIFRIISNILKIAIEDSLDF